MVVFARVHQPSNKPHASTYFHMMSDNQWRYSGHVNDNNGSSTNKAEQHSQKKTNDKNNNSMHQPNNSNNINMSNSDTDDELNNSFHEKSSGFDFDPCQAYTSNNKACIEACQATMMSVDHNMTMCGVSDLSRFHPSNYFTTRNSNVEDGEHMNHSPYLYSPSAPVGPTRCEYCGNQNTDDCKSNLPEVYLQFVKGGGNGNGANGSSGNANNNPDSCPPCSEACNATIANTTISSVDGSKNNNNNNIPSKENVCPRPQLFFLKKRPPFATPDGWDPITEYRTNLFEAPTTIEGMGRGWGEVRGHLGGEGGNATAAGYGGGGGMMNNSMNRSYAASGCGSNSAYGAGGGGGDTEISFSSAGGGGATNVSESDGARSLSPVQWVSGLMSSLSPHK